MTPKEREDWIQSMIRSGMGVSILPRYSLIEPELPHRHVIDPVMTRNVEFALAGESELSPALQQLVDHATRYKWSLDPSKKASVSET